MNYLIAIDIGGTTFNTGIFSESLNEIAVSDKDKIRYYDGKKEVIHAIIKQVNYLIKQNNIEMPICEQIYKVLFEDLSPRQAILALMGRELVDEHPE